MLADRCPTCGRTEGGRWSKRTIIEAICRWTEEHGGIPPSSKAWKSGNRPSQEWPSAKAVTRRFGTFSEAVREAGFEPWRHDTPTRKDWRERAATLADSNLSDQEIAKRAGASRMSIHRFLGPRPRLCEGCGEEMPVSPGRYPKLCSICRVA